MPDYIGEIEVPELVATEVWPLAVDYPHGRAIIPEVVIHRFGSGDAKIEQRFLLGDGAIRFSVVKRSLNNTERAALVAFWDVTGGPAGVFYYDAPDDQAGTTTRYTVRFENAPLSIEMLGAALASTGLTLVEVSTNIPEYALNSTVTRFPSTALKTALLSQVQRIIPLVKIQPLESGYPAIYVSDRRCQVGTQVYLPRLVRWEGITQDVGGQPDDAQFVFGNADRVMRSLANDTDLMRATVEFSLFHVGSGIKCDLWKGHVVNWGIDEGPEFILSASDGINEMGLSYPGRKCGHNCWKPFDDGEICPYSTQGSGGDPDSCDKTLTGAKGCASHGMRRYFGGINAPAMSARIKDTSTGTWGYRRSSITSVSLQAETIADQVLPEIYTDSAMPVNCKLASGREESDFYDALVVIGEGPLGGLSSGAMIDEAYQGPTLDGQPHHGFGTAQPSYGLRQALGSDPAGIDERFVLTTGQPGEVFDDVYAAGVAFQEIRRVDAKGFQPSALSEHSSQAVVTAGLKGWVWTDSGDHETFNRSSQKATLTNPIWIAVNMILRARGIFEADATTQLLFFDVKACADSTMVDGKPKGAALICDIMVAPLWTKYRREWTPEEGHWENGEWIIDVPGSWAQVEVTEETQFKFRGMLQEEKPLRDWLAEVLANCLGGYTFAFGKFKPFIRCNSSVVEPFMVGNILFESLRLGPAPAKFNDYAASFADEEHDFALRTMPLYDQDHAQFLGGGAGTVRLQYRTNLCGTFSKSQAARIITTRLREELGGINAAEWKVAREGVMGTTILALNVDPGMESSLTHPDMPGGYGEFRIRSWRLNPDYSIDLNWRTTTDSMYDHTIGPKPADVLPDPLPSNPYAEQPPNVLLFRAGRSNGDGTFAPAMYWDSSRNTMLIDWGCMLPVDRLNWSGVQIWIKRPDGLGGYAYIKATDILKLEQFAEAEDGTRYRYDTISVALESIPDPAEDWMFIAASYNRLGVMRQSITGVPLGPTVALSTLPKSDYALNFLASVVQHLSETGEEQWGISCTWTNAAIPRYAKTRIMLLNYGASGNVQQLSGDNPLADLSSLCGYWPWPATAQSVRVVIQSIFGDGSVAALTSCPYYDLVIERTLGSAGQEYCGLVTNIAISNVVYTTNPDGQKVFRATLTWTPPSGDVRYAGGSLWIIRSGIFYQLGGLDFNRFEWESSHWPTAAENVTFCVFSVDTLGRRNTYSAGVTPTLAYTWNPPTLGGAGQEYTSVVTGQSASVSYGATADGTYRALVTCAFTAPSVSTFGGVEIRTSEDSSATWKTRASAAKSPIVFELSVPVTATTYKVGFFSYDVNGRVNTYQSGTTPVQDIIVGNAAGQFDLSKAKATSYDPDIFVIEGGEFKVWAMNGSLIVTGTVSSAALNATAINVGGGGSKPGKFAVYNASGVQIGFVGVEDSYSGAWFKSLGIGGSSKASPKITANADGNVSINGATFTLTSGGITAEIANTYESGVDDYLGLRILESGTNPSRTGLGIRNLYLYTPIGAGGAWSNYGAQGFDLKSSVSGSTGRVLAAVGDDLVDIYLYGSSSGSPNITIHADGSSSYVQVPTGGGFYVGANKVVTTQQAAVGHPTVSIPTSGGVVADAFTGNAYNYLVELESKLMDTIHRLQVGTGHGLFAAH